MALNSHLHGHAEAGEMQFIMRAYYTHDTTRYPLSVLWSDLAPLPPFARTLGFTISQSVVPAGNLSYAARCDTIGCKRIFWLYLINADNSTFMRIQVALYDSEPATILRWSAHSYRADGTGIHTLPIEAVHLISSHQLTTNTMQCQ